MGAAVSAELRLLPPPSSHAAIACPRMALSCVVDLCAFIVRCSGLCREGGRDLDGQRSHFIDHVLGPRGLHVSAHSGHLSEDRVRVRLPRQPRACVCAYVRMCHLLSLLGARGGTEGGVGVFELFRYGLAKGCLEVGQRRLGRQSADVRDTGAAGRGDGLVVPKGGGAEGTLELIPAQVVARVRLDLVVVVVVVVVAVVVVLVFTSVVLAVV